MRARTVAALIVGVCVTSACSVGPTVSHRALMSALAFTQTTGSGAGLAARAYVSVVRPSLRPARMDYISARPHDARFDATHPAWRLRREW